MKFSIRSFASAGLAIALAASLAGCHDEDKNASAPPPPPVVQEVAPTVLTGANGVPQVVQYGCPVTSGVEMQQIFRGYYGVDGLSRPLNPAGIPVDTEGNCLSTAPVPEVYNGAVSPLYVGILMSRYHYSYIYSPGYVHVYSGPGVVYRTGVPTGTVRVVTTTPSTVRVTVAPGASTTVRPGAPAAAAPAVAVPAGNTTTVRPGAPAAAPAAATPAPATVTPPKAAAPEAPLGTSVTPPKAAPAAPTVFNRPAATPAPAAAPAPAPTSVTPPRAAPAAPSVFSRPAAPSYSAPAYRPAAPSGKR